MLAADKPKVGQLSTVNDSRAEEFSGRYQHYTVFTEPRL